MNKILPLRYLCCPLLLLLAFSVHSAEPILEKADVFPAGMNSTERYRIPGVVVTKKGTVLAYCEARKNGSSDWGEIEVHLRRSTDGGKTWADSQQIAHTGDRIEGNPHKKISGVREQTVNNPVAIIDSDTGDIVFLYCVNYARCFAMRSTDDGKTWSKPVDITETFVSFRKQYNWKVIATGPGHGIQLKTGRLVVPFWLAFGKEGDHGPSASGTIYSDDSGKTWKPGEIAVPNEGAFASPNETMLAECSDGKVMLVSRNYSKPNRKIVAYSPDGVTQWSKPEFHKQLWEPRCMASIVAYPTVPGTLIFSNPHTLALNNEGQEVPGGSGKRENLSIKISRDDGKTWPASRTLEAGPSAYSDLAVLPNGVILCLYEAGSDIKMARFPLAWVESNRSVPQPKVAYSLPIIDLNGQAERQVLVDREKGQYLGHPTTLLLEDGKTILCVYPKGHGRGPILYKRSEDGGKTWSDRLPTPKSWETSLETPTLHRVVDAKGKKRIILFSGLYPCRMAVSEDDGKSWSELKAVGDWGGIVTMSSVVELKTAGQYLALFHDDGRFIKKDGKATSTSTLYKSFSTDGGLTWSEPETIFKSNKVFLCEPGAIRSPNGKQIAVLLRENFHQKNSHFIFSDDEGKTWTEPRELAASLNGDRHVAKYGSDGRLFVSFRDIPTKGQYSPTAGDWVGWVGTYDDLVKGQEGQYRIRLRNNYGNSSNNSNGDCGYAGVELLPDGTFVAVTYGHWDVVPGSTHPQHPEGRGQPPYILSVRFNLKEIDELAKKLGGQKDGTSLDPHAKKVYAWYQQDGVKARGATVTEWETAAGSPSSRSLTHIVGAPQAVRVSTPSGDRTIVRFDGKSALWQASSSWGSLGGERTVVAYLRLAPKANGFLFDGSTNTGMTRAQVRDGNWQVGIQPPPIKNANLADVVTHQSITGEWQVHTLMFKKSAKGTEVSHQQGDDSKTVTTEATSPLGGFILGADVTSKLGLACEISEVIVYDRAVDAPELKAITAYLKKKWGSPTVLPPEKQLQSEALPDDPRFFRTILRKNGDDNVHTYRIPGLATTPKGTLIAVFDIRHKNGADLPGDIDVGMMRSVDDGNTWSEMQRIMDYDAGEVGSRGNGVGDPAILVDRKTGTIFVTALWSKGNRAWFGSGPGVTPEETGQFVICQSNDDGVTWSKPRSISPQVKDKDWLLCFQGPGNGIQLKDGTLVFPAQFKEKDKIPHSCFVASSDGGKNWTISPPAVPGDPPTSESAIVQLADGALLLSMRNEGRSGKRVWARWEWKDTITKGKWSEHWLDVTDPTCMASLISHPHGELILSNPNNSQRRDHLTIRTSKDGGQTWSNGKLLDPGTAMYSCLTVLKDGRIGVVYENGEGLVFARFQLDWVLGNDLGKDQAASQALSRELALAPVFTDSMVLQRGVPVPVWGTAEAGTSVTVTIADQRKRAKADDKGKWSVTLHAMNADSEPHDLKVVAGDATLTVRDVLVGEVWIAAGQSNMEFAMDKEAHAKAELPAADHPKLRLLNFAHAGQYAGTTAFGPHVLKRLTPDGFYQGTWQRCSPKSAKDFSAVGYFFGKELHQSIKVPVGIIHLAVGGSPTEAWVRRETLAGDKKLASLLEGNWLENERQERWCRQRGRENLAVALKDKSDLPKDETGPNHPFKPGFLWDAGISRLIPFPIQGVIWYQGESNSLDLNRVQQHERLFPTLVADWRKQWGLGDFPFYFCQLSSIGTEKGYKSQHWPEFRDGQRRMLTEIPNIGMAVTSDLGHPSDVHPRNKKDVGHRLALWALAKTYDKKVTFSGPLAKSARREGEALVVSFDHAEGGLQTSDDKPPRSFEIAGEDGVYFAASVTNGTSALTVTSDRVAKPFSVRYGWQPYSDGNLHNGEGLPASTFELKATKP